MLDQLQDLLGGFEGVSLNALDERAAVLRRIDNKYAVSPEEFARSPNGCAATTRFSRSTTAGRSPTARPISTRRICAVSSITSRIERLGSRRARGCMRTPESAFSRSSSSAPPTRPTSGRSVTRRKTGGG